MTTNQSDAPAVDGGTEPNDLDTYAASVAEAVGSTQWSTDFETIKVVVATDAWVAALATAKTALGLGFFSYLSAIHWSNDVAVGEPPAEPVDERIELLAAVGDLTEGRLVHFSTVLPASGASIPTLTGVYGGANWHEREAMEMFDIAFEGHPQPEKLYLPSGFEGHPLRKSFPLLSREVKPWPGTVDVEGMPEVPETTPAGATTENPGA